VKYVFLITFLCSLSGLAEVNLYHHYVERHQSPVNPHQDEAADRTRDAIMALPGMQERADQLLYKLQQNTLGEYTDEFMMLSPLFTGRLEFNVMKMNIYYRHHSEKAGVEYQYRF
tara:strand:+ start:3085 stop:3429 length:345 start_codon:yes stop_codon:yes gene_type:complete